VDTNSSNLLFNEIPKLVGNLIITIFNISS